MQENVAKNGWELTKVARIGRSRSLYGQTRVEGGVGQSREPKLSVCCLHNSAHPFLAKKRPGAPVFGHCPIKKLHTHSSRQQNTGQEEWSMFVFFFLCSLCAARSAPCTIPQRQLQLCGVEGGGYHTYIQTSCHHAVVELWRGQHS